MNPNEEEEEIATDSMYSIDELDPLADPLALDDELGDQTLEVGNRISDLDGSDDGQIILVDVNSLKNSFTIPVTYADNTIEIATSTNVTTTTGRDTIDTGINGETNPTNNDVGIGDVSFDQIGLTLDDEITEEVEGSRSDGSDSGLGLELCAGLLAEKTIASPTGKDFFSFLLTFAPIYIRELRSNHWFDPMDQFCFNLIFFLINFDFIETA